MNHLEINSQSKISPYVIDLKQIAEDEQDQEFKKSRYSIRKFFAFLFRNFQKIKKRYKIFEYRGLSTNFPLLRGARGVLKCLKNYILKQKSNRNFRQKNQIIQKRKSLIKIIDRAFYTIGEAVVHIPLLFYLPVKIFFISWLKLGSIGYQQISLLRNFKPAPIYLWIKEAGVFLLISALLILPVLGILLYKNLDSKKGQVLGAATEAVNNIKSAANNFAQADFTQAEENFKNVSNNFADAESIIGQAGILVQLISKLAPQGRTLEDLLEIGYNLSQCSILITQGLKEIQSKNTGSSITFRIKILKDKFQAAYPYLESANELIKNINPRYVPADYREQFVNIQSVLPQAEKGVNQAIELFDSLLVLLGHSSWQRYLFLLQNNNEIRPSGGFIGTVAILDIDQGKIKNLIIPSGGPYDFRASFSEKVLSPQPLNIVNPIWEMQDCNWFADFPSSAEKCQWFLEKSGGPSVNGVIAVNVDVLVELLKILGPIEISMAESQALSVLNNTTDQGQQTDDSVNLSKITNNVLLTSDFITITAENFVELTQNIVESDSAKLSGRPKAFLSELAPIVLKKLFGFFENTETYNHTNLQTYKTETKNTIATDNQLSSLQKIIDLSKLLSELLNKKSVQIYVQDKKLEDWLKSMSWAGEIKTAPFDYLLINVANVGGGKSDILIRQKITHQIEIKEDGALVSSVTIRREHLGRILSADEQNFLTPYEKLVNSRNIAYIRVYVPEGSELISATGGFYLPIKEAFKKIPANYIQDEDLKQIEQQTSQDSISGTIITHEFGKTVFGNYIWIEPGEFRTATFKYKLPFKLKLYNNQDSAIYSLLIQKQSGAMNQEFISRIKWTENYQISEQALSALGGNLDIKDNFLEYKSRLEAGDEFYGVVFYSNNFSTLHPPLTPH